MPDFAVTQAWNCGNSKRFPRKMLLEQGWTCEKNATFMEDARDRRADCSWARASKPGSESIRRVSVWSSSKNQETFLVGSEAYKLEVKASHMLLRGLHPT